MNIPGYSIDREIGSGGMATVYLAVQESLHRQVALKVMSPALAADKSYTARFLKEARTIAQLSHPHIVAIHDVGVVDYYHFLALEYISGGDLKQRIGQGMNPGQALDIVRQIAAALDHAHRKGVVHRDVKPENILFREDGSAVLTDFGIARASDSKTRMTGTGFSIGTPHYMSPEQARGKDVDGRADLYALGIVLYEMLTGKVPYDAEETLAIGIKHVTEPVPVLPASLAGYQSLIDRMLAKEPDDRYRSGEALIAAIENHDPKARPRPSAPRPTVVMPAVPSVPAVPSMPAANTPPTTAIGAVKGAMIGGAVAVGVLGAAYGFFGYQNQTPLGKGSGATTAAPSLPAPTPAAPEAGLRSGKIIKDCATCPEIVLISSGSFDMGSNNGSDYEKPVHRVSIRSFLMGKTEVTQGQWKAVMGNNPSRFSSCGDDCTVENVNWNDAQEYARKLSQQTGKSYRLPSEAEWEYACRAGGSHTYCGSDDVNAVGWYNANSDGKTHSVAGKQANAFGLYDMSGNVWEWVQDDYHDNYNGAPTDGSAWSSGGSQRVLRGGSWYNYPGILRSAIRSRNSPDIRFNFIGFRIARTL